MLCAINLINLNIKHNIKKKETWAKKISSFKTSKGLWKARIELTKMNSFYVYGKGVGA